jgi:hypothetical protein
MSIPYKGINIENNIIIENKDNMSILQFFSPIINKDTNKIVNQNIFSKAYIEFNTDNIINFLEKLSLLNITDNISLIISNLQLLKSKNININMFIEKNKIIFNLLIE